MVTEDFVDQQLLLRGADQCTLELSATLNTENCELRSHTNHNINPFDD